MCDDAIDRIILVTAFAVSSCASNADRIGKPFNPLLGETFELSRWVFPFMGIVDVARRRWCEL